MAEPTKTPVFPIKFGDRTFTAEDWAKMDPMIRNTIESAILIASQTPTAVSAAKSQTPLGSKTPTPTPTKTKTSGPSLEVVGPDGELYYPGDIGYENAKKWYDIHYLKTMTPTPTR